ncbi:MAG TPA: FecR family protein [bacterium]|nr:FecR family protein [bacterium]
MRKLSRYIPFPVFALLILWSSVSVAQENIAVTTKSEGEARLKRVTADTFGVELILGTTIQNQDRIRTGDPGFGVIVFVDDKSQLKIRSNSEIEILGDAERRAALIAKRVRMENGKLKAEISPQGQGGFEIITPTSVASVKGTTFWIVVDVAGGDRVFVQSGQVLLLNSASGDSVLIAADETGSSTPDGQVQTMPTATISGEVDSYTSNEQVILRGVTLISGELTQNITGPGPLTVLLNDLTAFEDTEPAPGDRVTVNGQVSESGDFVANIVEVGDGENRLEIDFEDESGNRKKLKINYR